MGCCYSTNKRKGSHINNDEAYDSLIQGEYYPLESGGKRVTKQPDKEQQQKHHSEADKAPLLHSSSENGHAEYQTSRQTQPLNIPGTNQQNRLRHQEHEHHHDQSLNETSTSNAEELNEQEKERKNSILQFQTKLLNDADDSLIDTTDHALVLEKEDPKDPASREYADTLKKVEVDEKALELLELPQGIQSSQSKTSLAQLFDAPPHAASQQQALQYVADSVTKSLQSSKIENPYGPLVVYFGDKA